MGSGSSKPTSTSNTNAHNNADSKTPAPANQQEAPKQLASEDVTSKSDTKEASELEGQNSNATPKSKAVEKKAEKPVESNDGGIDPEAMLPQDQAKFDSAIRFSNLLIKPDSIMKIATPGVQKLELKQALPPSLSLFSLLQKLPNLQIVDISGNNLGPPGFRAIMLSLCHNSTITTLNIADNQTDTDSAECIGTLLRNNKTLTCLNVSGNYLGLDFFSRCVGPAIAENSSLQILKCESIGSTDMNVLGENLRKNSSLKSLSLSSNELSNPEPLVNHLSAWLMESSCTLNSLGLRNIGMKENCVDKITEALACNSSLESLDVSANQCSQSSCVMSLILSCICHKSMTSLIADDLRATSSDSWAPGDRKPTQASCLASLSVAGCGLKDEYFTTLLSHAGNSALSALTELNFNNNASITNAALESIARLTSLPQPEPEEGTESNAQTSVPASVIKRLSFGHNSADNLSDVLLSGAYPNLQYLNLRRAKIGAAGLEKLAPLFNGKKGKVAGCIGTLVLDSLKLANTGVFATLISQDCQLVALSLASCQLNDSDLAPLCTAIKSGAPFQMLKLSDNRLTDEFLCSLCDALQSKKNHPLALIDIANNSITSKGAQRLAQLLTSKKSQLHSINVSFNNIDGAGVAALAACVGKSSLQSLNANKQDASYLEEDCDKIFKEITKSFGLKVTEEGEIVKQCTADIPAKLPDFISFKLTNLGGSPGELGKALYCRAILTDYGDKKIPHLTLQDALELASYFKGQDTTETVLSGEDWSAIIGTKDTPTWLQLAKHRDCAVYMTSLPASITVQKMDGLLESEADCNVDEICLLKDMVTRKNNGLAWVLMSDADSVTRAVELYQRGEAAVFSQPFTISRVRVVVDDGASDDAKARQDMAARAVERKQQEAAHRALIERSYLESQARHAYRLAHPAYADGRIW